MPTKHVTKQIEAYLDRRLPAAERSRVEEHLSTCPVCAHRLFEAKRLTNELGPLMQRALGQPVPPAALRHKIRQKIKSAQKPDRFHFLWATSGRLLDAVGAFGVVAILLLATLFVIQGQLPDATGQQQLSAGQDSEDKDIITPTKTPTPVFQAELANAPAPVTSLGDRLPPNRNAAASEAVIPPQPQAEPPANQTIANKTLAEERASDLNNEKESKIEALAPPIPAGLIAFSFFNVGAAFYEIHLVNPDGQNRHRFSVAGVSEPALRKSESGAYQIAYRAWGEPTAPRALISNDLADNRFKPLTDFWEDAHPDWSPTENRIIFASQREGDRRWRLYTIWGDGSAEVELRREGKSPTFAPDGYRFAFVSCEAPLKKEGCGLLVGDLDNSEYGAELILEAPLAEAPDWSPVDEQIVYMANPDGNWDLYLTNSAGRAPRRLTNDPAIDGLPVWSPDGQWLAFLSNRGGQWAVWALHLATGQTQLVVDFNEGDLMKPNALSPYGQRDWQDEQLSWVE